MTTEKRLMTNLDLTKAVTEAVLAALKAGMEKEEIAAVLTKIAELTEAD